MKKEMNVMDEQKDVQEKTSSYDYSTPIDFRPNRIDDRLNILDKKVGENSERLVKLEVLTQKLAEDVADIRKSVDDLADKNNNTEQKLMGKIDDMEQKLTNKINDVEQKLTNRINDVEQKFTEKIDSLEHEIIQLKVTSQNLVKSIADLGETVRKQGLRIDTLYNLLVSSVILGIASIILTVIFKLKP